MWYPFLHEIVEEECNEEECSREAGVDCCEETGPTAQETIDSGTQAHGALQADCYQVPTQDDVVAENKSTYDHIQEESDYDIEQFATLKEKIRQEIITKNYSPPSDLLTEPIIEEKETFDEYHK